MNKQLLHTLQNKVKDKSVNELYAVYPEMIAEMAECSDEEALQFIEDLSAERLVHKKIDYECECGRLFTLYYRKLLMEKKCVCPECGKEHALDLVLKKGQLIYEIDKEGVLEYDSFLARFNSMNSGKGIYKNKNMESERAENQMDRVKTFFIGSSSAPEAIQKMDDVAVILEDLGYEVRKWNDPIKPVFKPSEYTYDNLINVTKETDGAVFIFNSDDEVWCSKSDRKLSKVRDNVLLEYGLFTGVHGRKSVAFVVMGDTSKPTIATDLDGITYIDGDKKNNTLRQYLMTWANEIDQ